MRQTHRSQSLFHDAERLLVSGVNSPVRAFKAVGGDPLVIARAQGPYVFDADGNRYIDYVCGWGPMILGHAHPAVVAAVQQQASQGMCFGMTCELELELARLITRHVPSIEMVRFVCSGTEATMSAVRLARAFTGRNLIVKFDGCYHGHGDSFLANAGSGLATFGIAASPGVPQCLAELTLSVPYNNLRAVERVFAEHARQIAGVILEPVAANMGVVLPEPEFLSGLRDLTRKHDALLIFDEVITGFRLGLGGAQGLYQIQPDLTTLGKIIGGGLPVAAYGGRRDVMSCVAPLGSVYQAGTLAGNPLGMRAGIETLRLLETASFYETLDQKAKRLADGLRAALAEAGVRGTVNAVGSLLTLFFAGTEVSDYESAKRSDTPHFAASFRAMLDHGVFLPPSQFEAWFVSAAHSDSDIDQTLRACRESLSFL